MFPTHAAFCRWMARLLGLPALLFVSAHFLFDGFPNPARLSASELWLLGWFLTALVGLAVLWKWRLLGGLMTLVGIVAFYAAHYAAEQQFPAGWALPMIAAPGLLSVLGWLLERPAPPRPQRHTLAT